MFVGSNRGGDRSTIARMFWCCTLVPLLVRSTIAFKVRQALPSLESFDSPVWNHVTNNLFFIGTSLNTVFKYVPSTEDYSSVKFDNGKPVTFVVLANGTDRYAIGTDTSVSVFEWNGKSNQVIALTDNILITSIRSQTLSMGTVDAKGRLFVGTKDGLVYSVLADSSVTRRLSGIKSLGGIAFSVSGTEFYYTDRTGIMKHKFNLDSGDIDANGTMVFDFAANQVPGNPAGIVLDSTDHAWVACGNTNQIVQIDTKTSALLTTNIFHDSSVTGVTFGGNDLSQVYVTTSNTGKPGSGGSLFELSEINSKGMVAVPFSFGSPT